MENHVLQRGTATIGAEGAGPVILDGSPRADGAPGGSWTRTETRQDALEEEDDGRGDERYRNVPDEVGDAWGADVEDARRASAAIVLFVR